MKKDNIKKWVEDAMKNLGVVIEAIDLEDNDSVTIISVKTPESQLIIGQNGEVLHALNHLLRRFVDRGAEEKAEKFIIDVNGYRKKAEDRVRGIAAMLGERAITFKSEVAMEPTGSFERRVVHALFQDHPNLVTESKGFGRDRHVIIKFVEVKSAEDKLASK